MICSTSFAAVNNITEEDGSPSVYPWKLKVSNGSLTDNGDGTASLAGGSASAGGSNTQVQFNDGGSLGGDGAFTHNKTTHTTSVASFAATGQTTKTADYTITTSDNFIMANATNAASLTITLPTATGSTGRLYTVKRISNGATPITLATTLGQTIDGQSTITIVTPNTSLDCVSDNTNWRLT